MFECRFRGITFRISLLFFAMVTVLLTLDRTGIAAWCVAAAALHEAGHFAAMALCGKRPSLIAAGAFGVRIEQETGGVTYGRQAFISFAGPFVNLLCAGLIGLTHGWGFPALAHAGLGLFQLLPVAPLDGGQALRALLSLSRPDTAVRIVYVVSYMFLIPLTVAGIVLALYSGHNISLLAVAGYLWLCMLQM